MATFHALEVAHQLDAALRPVVAKIARSSPRLADQIDRASESNVLALAEGTSRTGREMMRFWRTALGSAREIKAALRRAVAVGAIFDGDLAAVAPLVDRTNAIDFRLVFPKPK